MKKFWKKATRKQDAHAAAVPPAPPTSSSSTATPTASSLTAEELTLANASPIFAILKDGGEMLKDVPYLKAIAGILNTIFKIWEEIKDVDNLTEELLEGVKRRSEKLLRSLQVLVQQGRRKLVELEDDLGDYKQLLENIMRDLQTMQTSGSIGRWLQRTDSRDRIHAHMRRLTEFSDIFSISRLTTMASQVDTLVRRAERTEDVVTKGNQNLFKDGQPAVPRLVVGRGTELGIMKKTLLEHSGPRLAILGPGGIGKTTLAQQLMNDNEVSKAFPIPLFVSCENITTSISILHALADVLHIPATQRGETLQTNVIKQMYNRRGCLLCLDNFEDAWDPPSTRQTVEDLLTVFDGIRLIGIIVTMRGTEKPRGLNWTYPQPATLEPLQNEPALALFEAVSHCSRDSASTLLKAVDNVPLAIMLLGRLVEEEGFEYVLQQWKKEGLKVVDRGDASDSRTTSVTASIKLSLNSPRISSIPFIYEVLAILALLPDGLSEAMIDALEANLPPGVDLRRVLQALRRIALCYLDSKRRYRLLALIRQHVKKALSLDPGFFESVRRTFFEHVIETTALDHDAVVPEMLNIRSFVASESTTWSETCILACLDYLWWEDYVLGIRDIPLALIALSHADTPLTQVKCRLRISQLFKYSSQHDKARENLYPALSVQTEDPFWEGCIRLELGEIERLLDNFEEAATFLRQAVKFFKAATNLTWEAVALERLGTLLRVCRRTSEAEELLMQSLQLTRNANDVAGEGNALLELGEVYRLTGRMPQAEDVLCQAVGCYTRSHSVLGRASALRSLGEVQYALGNFDESEKSLLNARDLFKRIHDSAGQAAALRWLGLLYTQMDGQLELAETFLQAALVLYQQISNMDYQARIHQGLGYILSRQGHPLNATTHWVISIAFHLRRLHESKWEQVVTMCAQIEEELEGTSSDSADSEWETDKGSSDLISHTHDETP